MDELLKKLEFVINLMQKSQTEGSQDILKQVNEIKELITKMNGLSDEEKAKIAKFDEMQQQITKMAEELDKLMKDGNVNPDNADDLVKFEQDLNNYFKTGIQSELIMKAFSTSEGAVLIPQPRAKEIIKQIQETSPVLRNAKMYSISKGDSLSVPVRKAGTNNAAKQAEGAARGSESTLSYGELKLEVEKIVTWSTVTSEMIDDSDFNVVGEVMEVSSEYLADYLSKKVWDGKTGEKIVGIYQTTEVTSGALETATASTVTWEDLKNLIYSLPPSVRVKSAFYVSTAMLSTMRGFKDDQGRPLYTESLVAGEPGIFMGYRVYEDVYMQDLTADNYPAFFGDMAKFYAWLNRKGVYMEKDRQASNDTYDFYTRIRIGGKVRDKSQGKLLKVKGV